MINVRFHESEYEEVFVEELYNEGWTYTPGCELAGRLITDALYEPDLRNYLKSKYCNNNLSELDYDQIIANLRNTSEPNDYLTARAVHKLVCHEGYDYQPLDGSDAFKVRYIDFDADDIKTANIFRCINQFEMVEGEENRRPDVVLMINGIPLCVIELKNPADPDATISNAWEQICKRYRRDTPSMMKYAALTVISDGANTRMGGQFTPEEYYYAWKKVENKDPNGRVGIDEMLTLIKGALSPIRILEILRDYVYFADEAQAQKEIEIVCRYPQFFATRKLRESIFKALHSAGGNGKGGTYFGATGCGKTHTMLFLARQLMCRYATKMSNPTIVVIVDRSDLEDQSGLLFCNAMTYLEDTNIKVFDSRDDLRTELRTNLGGGLYVTTIQNFAEGEGMLSDRSNIICLSDEAHRTQVSMGSNMRINTKSKTKEEDKELKLVADDSKDDKIGAFFTETFAQQLHRALPSATFVGFTGTPVEETIQVFGAEVDRYTMEEAKNDKITVPITYNARLARVYLNSEQAKKVEEYYKKCEEEGASAEDVDKSKDDMSQMKVILGNEERLERMAKDIVAHYEQLRDLDPDLVQKAMVVSSDRHIAFNLYQKMLAIRPEWGEKKRALDESLYTKEELDEMDAVQMLNVICTRDKNKDSKAEWDAFGTDADRKKLEGSFKDDKSNFQIAIVVDMWITGFDVPCLKVLYNDKPLSKHTLIQTISRVNRRYKTKDCGLIVDYLGIRENMKAAIKKYNGDSIEIGDEATSYSIFKNELSILQGLMQGLAFEPFFSGNAAERLKFLQDAAEYILEHSVKGTKKKPSMKTLYLGHVKRMRAAYNIVKNALKANGTPMISEEEAKWAQCMMGIAGFLGKMTDTQHNVQTMNRHVEQMVKEAIGCSSVEIVLEKDGGEEDIYSEKFKEELEQVTLPNTRFELLVKLLRKSINEYSKTNRTRAEVYDKLLQQVIDQYNNREYANEVASSTISEIGKIVDERVNSLSDQLLEIMREMEDDKKSFEKLGISFEEKAFYDVLVKMRDEKGFIYTDERCKELAKKIKTLVDGSTVYADFLNNTNLKSKLDNDLKILLFKNGYPPQWNNETVEGVMAQVVNYKSNQQQAKIIKMPPKPYTFDDYEEQPMMVAEDIIIPGSLEVRLRNTKKEELLAKGLDLVLMYAISPVARKKTESSEKIALGIKEENLSKEAIVAYESVKYIMFHYWKNVEATPFELTASTRLVTKQDIPEGFLIRQDKDAKQYLLIEYNSSNPTDLGEYDILKAQRKGSNRYIPFVCKVDNLK